MPQLHDPEEPLQDESDDHVQVAHRRDVQRDMLRAALDQIALAVTVALQDKAHVIPLLFSVPSSGDAILAVATPADPSNAEWAEIIQAICQIVIHMIDVRGLIGRPVVCAAAGAPVNAAEVSGTETGGD